VSGFFGHYCPDSSDTLSGFFGQDSIFPRVLEPLSLPREVVLRGRVAHAAKLGQSPMWGLAAPVHAEVAPYGFYDETEMLKLLKPNSRCVFINSKFLCRVACREIYPAVVSPL
jgi:hypothetical protein